MRDVLNEILQNVCWTSCGTSPSSLWKVYSCNICHNWWITEGALNSENYFFFPPPLLNHIHFTFVNYFVDICRRSVSTQVKGCYIYKEKMCNIMLDVNGKMFHVNSHSQISCWIFTLQFSFMEWILWKFTSFLAGSVETEHSSSWYNPRSKFFKSLRSNSARKF